MVIRLAQFNKIKTTALSVKVVKNVDNKNIFMNEYEKLKLYPDLIEESKF